MFFFFSFPTLQLTQQEIAHAFPGSDPAPVQPDAHQHVHLRPHQQHRFHRGSVPPDPLLEPVHPGPAQPLHPAPPQLVT